MSEITEYMIEDEDGALTLFVLKNDYDATEAARVKAQAECVRLASQVRHWQDLAVANRKVADESLAELSALKAQQEPVAWRVTGAGGLTVTPEYPKWAEDDSRLLIESLYTAPQPAPAQDVAGPTVPALTGQEAEDLREFHEAVCCDAGHRVEKEGMRRLAEIGAVESVGFGKHRLTEFGVYLLAAHDKQSGGEE